MILLITGLGGSAARLMVDHYASTGDPTLGLRGVARSEQYVNTQKNIQVITCDLNDAFATARTIRSLRPTAILHLAANADVRASWDQPGALLHNNIQSSINLLEAIRYESPKTKLVVCSTSEVYGNTNSSDPIKEDAPINPVNPYAVSKTTQEMLARVYGKAYGIPVIVTRMFGYINPIRTNLFVSSFAKQIALIEKGGQGTLWHGNLKSKRTLLDHRDMCSAYAHAVRLEKPGTFNIGSTNPVSVGEVLYRLKELSTVNIKTEEDPRLMRPVDIAVQTPDTSKFTEETGWAPTIPLQDSLVFVLNYWRAQT